MLKIPQDVKTQFELIDTVVYQNAQKVQKAFREARISYSDFVFTTGYGYGDTARDKMETVFASYFGAEDALVRPQIVSGTHAITLGLFAVLRPGDELLIFGNPYKTFEEVIGKRGKNQGSLKEWGITYKILPFTTNPEDLEVIFQNNIQKNTRMLFIQKSRGYDLRPTLLNEEIKLIIKIAKKYSSNLVVLVDNCYGEMVEPCEPIEMGADLIAGSLIKNLGAGIAPTGGYLAGKKELIEQAAYRLTAPGLGKEVGPSLGFARDILQGFYFAPKVVGEALKIAVLLAYFLEKTGVEVLPEAFSKRGDIVQTLIFRDKEKMLKFVQTVQEYSPIDNFVTIEPSLLPGYDSPIVMASGSFVAGSSIDLSADGPFIPPYVVYFQGGIALEYGMILIESFYEKFSLNYFLK
ncbi:methionine gamma-lyase family protein [Carboxydothermus ferrireducens]|uniref:Cystathionine beta-lyase family protein involved in aluminum resistance n=1 Tax=Carboxydothermus ferrireducens DSM 11255 TaxID=1119529 RepID=A0ABX2RAF5_9THEO|nr:methionine gamma-lyase family protein [Carboxydothermus ferrireducens]NYE58159.1 cystathionine beta-lyase family protein involved in aluminum resistance [Carboxydothermus ferrireducens DSM 11255]